MKNEIIFLKITPKFQQQRLGDVLTEFYRLGELKRDDTDMQNYIIIRLVTIIEQFFRKVLELRIKNKTKSRLPGKIKLNISDLDSMKEFTKEIIISASYHFQNINDIKEGMRSVGLSNVFNNKIKNCDVDLKQLEDLFQLRHDTVHTVISVSSIDIEEYYKITENMIQCVLNQARGKHFFYFIKGVALGRLDRHEESIACFDTVITLAPKKVDAYIGKGVALGRWSRHEDALACFDTAIMLDPKKVDAYYYKGIAFSLLNRYEDAITCFDTAITLAPKKVDAYIGKGSVLWQLDRHEDALACFDTVITLDPKNITAYMGRGITLGQLDRHEDALACFDTAITLAPKKVDAYIYKELTLGLLNKHDEAKECHRKIKELKSQMDNKE